MNHMRTSECGMRNNIVDTKILLYGGMLSLMLITSVAWAQEAEKDPFFPSEQRPTVQVPTPTSNEWGRDPFANPLGTKAVPRQEHGQGKSKRNLTGIIYGKHERLAIIGGEVMREGSLVGEKKLVDIRKKSVMLMDAAGVYEEIVIEDFSVGK